MIVYIYILYIYDEIWIYHAESCLYFAKLHFWVHFLRNPGVGPSMKQPETPERWNVLEKSGPSVSMIRRVSKVNNFEMALIPGRGVSPMICDWKPWF